MMMTMILCLLSPRSWWLLLLFFCSYPTQTPIASLQKKIKKIMLQGISRKSFQFHQVKEFPPKSTLFSSQRAVMTTANKPLTQSPIWSRYLHGSHTPPPPFLQCLIFISRQIPTPILVYFFSMRFTRFYQWRKVKKVLAQWGNPWTLSAKLHYQHNGVNHFVCTPNIFLTPNISSPKT